MLAISELPENPVTLTMVGDEGQRHAVTTERLKGGRVRMRCTCAMYAREGWCRHLVQLLCMRYDAVEESHQDQEFKFEDIVLGTQLEDLAHEVDLALNGYEQALREFEAGRPVDIAGETVETVSVLAQDLADAARQLAHAIGRFKKTLAAAGPS